MEIMRVGFVSPKRLDDWLAEEREYWMAKLAGELRFVGLPLDFPRPAEWVGAYETVPLLLGEQMSAVLLRISNRRPTLAFTVLVAALEVCLYRYTGLERVTVGTAIHQQHAETMSLNQVVPLHGGIDPAMTVRELLGEVKRTLSEAFAHQKYPFDRLLELLELERPGNRNPLFGVFIRLAEIHARENLDWLRCDVMIDFAIRDGSFIGEIAYRPALHQRATLEVFARHFRRTVAALTADPDAPVGSLDLLDEEEHQFLVVDFNAGRCPVPQDTTVLNLFTAQAARDPKAVATVFQGEVRTYRELDERSNRLAHHLRGLGVRPGVRVGLFLEPSPDLVVAVLAVLKAGGAFVPLDPEHPGGRRSYIAADSGMALLVTESALAGDTAAEVARQVRVDTDSEEIGRQSAAPLGALAGGWDTAYVIYTSGSTGQPKGVTVAHAQLVNYLWWANETYLRREALSCGLYTSIAFDLAITSLFLPLISGNRLVVYARDRRSVTEVVEDGQVGLLKLTPSHLALLPERLPRDGGVRRIVVGGESFERGLARRLHELFDDGVEIYNEYGPTETTVGCMIHRFDPDRDRRTFVPIGVPAANAEIFLLDGALRSVAENMVGEIYIGGNGVATGYLGRPELTAERFLPNPFASGARMYRSGDLARRLPGGVLEYLGRNDDQVKFNGYRVELNEIRSALNRHPKVRDSAVLLTEESGHQVLVGYYAAREEVPAEELHDFLAASVIEATVPSLFCHLRKLPLNLNGKVDVKALPALEEAREKLRRPFVSPRTAAEKTIAAIWSDLLSVELIGIHDNFFQLGGHSLIAAQVISRLRHAFGVELPLRRLFDAPTVARLAEIVDCEAQEEGIKAPAIRRVPRDRELPLSFAQQRLWFLNRLEPDNPYYNMSAALRLRGPLDLDALGRSWNEIVRRHEVLRTTFSEVDGRPVQVVHPPRPVSLPVVDLAALGSLRETILRGLVQEEARYVFDLECGPLLRCRLFRMAPDENVLLFTTHHIASDGWSIDVLERELTLLYGSCRSGDTSPLPELSIQYADFAHWQRQWLSGEVLEAELAYWRDRLANSPPVLVLPTDRPRPAVQTYRGARVRFQVPDQLTAALRRRSQERDGTLFMTLLAGLQALLALYSGQDDLCVGTPIAGRNRLEIEGLIGFFVNTLVLRSPPFGEMPVSEALDRVRDSVLEAQAHQELPFERLVEELQPQRSLGHSPLFQVIFSLGSSSRAEPLQLAGIHVEPLDAEVGTATAKFDLTLVMTDAGERLAGSIVYNRDLFDGATLLRLVRHFENLLAGLAADPARRLADLPVLTAAEKHQLLLEWRDTARDPERLRRVDRWFECQAAAAPERIALSCGVGQWTYRDLDLRAERLAARLAEQRIGPSSRVAVCVERSPELVAALLAVWKAGAAFVPLDPSHPPARLDAILDDAGIDLILTDATTAERAANRREIRVDEDRDDGALEPVVAVRRGADDDGLAYWIYTSGSTGAPKGVQVRHSAFLNYLASARDVYLRGERLTFALHTSVAFDLTLTSIFLPLVTGNTLVVYGPGSDEISQVLSDGRAEVVKLTPSHLSLVREEDARASRVRRLIVGGEAFETDLARRVAGYFGEGVEIYNEYGPTEATVACMIHRFDPAADRGDTVPIGLPAANAAIYVLDRRMSPVPQNVAGEIYIGGLGVADGYMNRPELTAERFLPNPFVPDSRMYRTGDVARRLWDGRLVYLGRNDNQVKYHGYRVELNEIRSAINRYPQVRDSAVLLLRDGRGEPVLVAYYAARKEVPAEEFRSFLSQHLLAATIPGVFVHLRSLPLDLSGKINHRALPGLGEVRGQRATAYAPPRNPVEEIVAEIWSEVLRTKRVGVHDNFFDLGGHSLLATQVLSRLRSVLGVDLSLRHVFEAPTVAQLAEMAAARGLDEAATALPMERVSRNGDLPLSFAQERLWFIDQLDPGSAAYNIAVALRLTGDLDVAALARALDEIVRRHEVLRTTFASSDGRPVQVIAPYRPRSLSRVDLTSLPASRRESESRLLAMDDARRPFDMARGPLLRGALLEVGSRERVLLFNMHHVVSDGWSMQILRRELSALYQAFSAGRPSPLPELPLQYADFSAWQRQWLQGERWDAEMDYWREQLKNLPASLELPTDRPRPELRHLAGGLETALMPAGLVDRLKALGRAQGATLFMTLLAAFQALLHRYSGQEDLAVGSPIAGRNRLETEALIGFFVNVLVLRSDASGDPAFGELLGRARETVLGANARQDLPFERLVEELQPERSLGYTPLFQVLFTFQSMARGRLDLGAVEMTPLDSERSLNKFDLTLGATSTADATVYSFEYARDLFDRTTVVRLLDTFRLVLEEAAADPARRLSELELMRRAERHQVLVEWSGSIDARHPPAVLHHRFEAAVDRDPDALALVTGEVRLSYRELDLEANRIAQALLARGVEPRQRIAVLVESGRWQAPALLGVLKAGCVFVCLDARSPARRMVEVLSELAAPVLLVETAVQEGLPDELTSLTSLLGVDQLRDDLPADRPAVAVEPWDACYIAFTSGSTGRPKGIVQSHASFVQFLDWQNECFSIQAPARVAQWAALSYDAAYGEIFGALCYGATLCAVGPEVKYDPPALLHWLRQEEISLFQVVPSFARQLLHAAESAAGGGDVGELVPHLEWFLLAGEALPRDLAQRCLELFGRRPALFNLYGPSETVLATFHPVQEVEAQRVPVPVGRAIDGRQILVLDRSGRPCPIGVVGEIYIRSPYLTLGYFERPDETRRSFVGDPLGGKVPAYRTGDLGRWRTDGRLEFRGRADQQVKIRGMRVELGEVEAVLSSHASVVEGAVVLHGYGELDRLVAYVVSAGGMSVGELQRFTKERLPEHMVPDFFVEIEALPRTTTGKLDRKALPRPAIDRQQAGGEYVAPRNLLEAQIAECWRELLQLGELSVHDNFFDLGGHSLLATRVVSRLRQIFAVELPLRDLFAFPTVAGLALAVEQALGRHVGSQAPPIEAVPRDRPLPLSFAQERLWFIDQLEPGTSVYHMPAAQWLTGDLDVRALAHSFDEIVRRHEVLRTIYAVNDAGEPVQIVLPHRPRPLPIVDLSQLPATRSQSEVLRLADEDARRPFELDRGPLLRTSLVDLGHDERVLLFNMHHIASDAWSMQVLASDLAALYPAFAEGKGSPLPELAIQYADYAVWQRNWLAGDVLAAELEHWRNHLAGLPPSLELATDRPRPVVGSSRGNTENILLSPALTAELRALGRTCGATLFMTLMAAFQELLRRQSGQQDLAIGTPVAGRNRMEVEGLVGFFVNTLVLRGDFSGAPTAVDLLRRVRDSVLEAHAHQDLPFEKLVEELQPERRLGETPLFQVMFLLHHAGRRGQFRLGGAAAHPLQAKRGAANFNLTLGIVENESGLGCVMEYATDLFDPVTIRRMLEHFRNLAQRIANDPLRPVSEFELSGEAERHQILIEWSHGTVAEPVALVHKSFEAQVERTPESIAVVAGGEALTYRELNARANRLAHLLQARGAGPEALVGLYVDRSLDMVIALLGVLKAGGAYVPLDPTYPGQRLELMLADAGVRLLVAHERAAAGLEFSGELLFLDRGGDLQTSIESENPRVQLDGANSAYVIYTSGSTGKPKGTVATHGSLANYIDTTVRNCAIRPGDRLLQFASVSFDTSAEEIYPTLARGATLVLRDDSMLGSPEEFLERCEEWSISVLDLSTAYWHELVGALAAGTASLPSTLRLMVVGGERLRPEPVAFWRDRLVDVQLCNGYGPTEATIVATWCTLSPPPGTAGETGRVPIGRPVRDVDVHILDLHLRPVPIGLPGEIWIAGAGLARGYLGRPDLTAEKFLPHPCKHGERLYRTGDLGRRFADGQIECLGRIDQQIKVRGFRVELGEIEAVLAEYPGLRECVVLPWGRETGAQRLVAYVVTTDDEPAFSQLRTFLRQRLPEYMVPASFVTLPALPLTPSGKVDRRSLPAPEKNERDASVDFVAPATPAEELVAAIWAELLVVDQVGVHDNFFDLGGHSLMATRVISRLRQVFQVEVPLRRVFEEPTVAGLVGGLIAAWGDPETVEEIARTYQQIELLSDDEVQMLLTEEG